MDIALLIARVLLVAMFLIAGLASGAHRLWGASKVGQTAGPAPAGMRSVRCIGADPRSTVWLGAVGASGLLILFITGIGLNLARGNAPDCLYFGQLHSAPAGWPILVRSGLLALVAGLVVWQGGADAGPGAVSWLSGFSTVGQWLFVAAIVTLLGVGWKRGSWLISSIRTAVSCCGSMA